MGEDQIVGPAQDEIDNAEYRNPFELDKLVKERMPDKDRRYYELFGNSEQLKSGSSDNREADYLTNVLINEIIRIDEYHFWLYSLKRNYLQTGDAGWESVCCLT